MFLREVCWIERPISAELFDHASGASYPADKGMLGGCISTCAYMRLEVFIYGNLHGYWEATSNNKPRNDNLQIFGVDCGSLQSGYRSWISPEHSATMVDNLATVASTVTSGLKKVI